MKEVNEIPVWHKWNLTIQEASKYFNIGGSKLREITDNPDCDFVLFIGTKKLIKRIKFEEYLESEYSL